MPGCARMQWHKRLKLFLYEAVFERFTEMAVELFRVEKFTLKIIIILISFNNNQVGRLMITFFIRLVIPPTMLSSITRITHYYKMSSNRVHKIWQKHSLAVLEENSYL